MTMSIPSTSAVVVAGSTKSDADIARQRFLEREGGFAQSANIVAITKQYQAFIHALKNQNQISSSSTVNDHQVDVQYNTLLSHINTYHAYISRLLHINDVAAHELYEYRSEEQLINTQIQATKDEIAELKTQIDAANQWRGEQEEYDNLMRECDVYPSRQATIQQIRDVEQQIQQTQQQIAELESNEIKRQKDMSLFMHALRQLQSPAKSTVEQQATSEQQQQQQETARILSSSTTSNSTDEVMSSSTDQKR